MLLLPEGWVGLCSVLKTNTGMGAATRVWQGTACTVQVPSMSAAGPCSCNKKLDTYCVLVPLAICALPRQEVETNAQHVIQNRHSNGTHQLGFLCTAGIRGTAPDIAQEHSASRMLRTTPLHWNSPVQCCSGPCCCLCAALPAVPCSAMLCCAVG